MASALSALSAPTRTAHVISTEDEALEIAREVAQQFSASASERDRDRRLPIVELDELSMSGLLGVTAARNIGGPAVSVPVVAEIFRLLAAADASLAQIPQSHMVFLNGIALVGSPTQQRFFFTEALKGRRFGNAQAEPATRGGGRLETRLTAVGDHFVLSGKKDFCTGALFADWIPVLAEGPDTQQRIAYVEAHAPGLTIVDDWDGMGQRTTASGTVYLDKVIIEPDRIIDHFSIFSRPQVYGAFAQLLHCAIDVGLATGALDEAVRITRGLSSPWFESGVERPSDEQLLVQSFGELALQVRAAEALLHDAARAVGAATRDLTAENAAAASIAVSAAKVFGARAAVATADGLFEVVGTRAAAATSNLSRYWRDARTHTLHDPVRWKVQHIGRYVLNGTLPPRNGLI